MHDKSMNPPSRWVQFNITSLLVVTTITGLLVGWWRDRAHLVKQLELERALVEEARFETKRVEVDVQLARQQAMAARYTADKVQVEMQAKLDELQAKVGESDLRQTSQAPSNPTPKEN
jgi:hypothetical protein